MGRKIMLFLMGTLVIAFVFNIFMILVTYRILNLLEGKLPTSTQNLKIESYDLPIETKDILSISKLGLVHYQ